MPHSFVACEYHCVWSTKERRPLLSEEIRENLYPLTIRTALNNRMQIQAVGRIEDHIHILLSIPATRCLSDAIQLIKGISSKWINDEFSKVGFTWQQGYGAFSIGVSQRTRTIEYILNQAQHHQQVTFEEEFKIFLKRHGLKCDEKYIFG